MDISSLNNYFELYGGMAIFIVVLLEYMNLPGFPAGIIISLGIAEVILNGEYPE